MKKILTLHLFILTVCVLSSCSHAEKTQHIEVFVTETSEQNAEGFSETTGYKKVNSITNIEESTNDIKTDIKAVEDYYDTERNYIRTEIIHSNYNKSYNTKAEDGDDLKKVIHKPSTILIPDKNIEHFKLDDMTKEEKEKVKEHVLNLMDMVEN
ncbi:hypothetical protein GCM10008983_17440 [Lentibacillus halophilus]|uniref:Sporulation lipoprotein YhcN/YlaJ (Spore_YhcN_YlaJ) n=1 Tax=Lentibacillus halophilus TaxID=295065 RepID=A0ABN0ZB17_9BACI